MKQYRVNAQGQSYVITTDDGSAFPPKPMSLREVAAWCALFAVITFGGIALAYHYSEAPREASDATQASSNNTPVGIEAVGGSNRGRGR